ncbi:MAG: DUF2585 family protein [Acidobacteria bacterium]|nr:DUF2585 family protein [Acidobacteriota bacterium]
MPTAQQTKSAIPYILSVIAAAAMTASLVMLGRLWWCKYGDWRIYINEAWHSSHTSQHLFDPYTFTHILHGILFLWLASLLFGKLANGWKFFIAILAEAAWEVLENTSFIIEKYRENTAALDYYGDSIFNSIGDLVACSAGSLIAVKIGLWRSLIFFVVVEAILILWIRDSLLLNILMLVYPLAVIKQWQAAIS